MANTPKLTQEQLYQIRMARPHERRDNVFGIQLERRSDASRKADASINRKLRDERQNLKKALANDLPEDMFYIPEDGKTVLKSRAVHRAEKELQSVEALREALMGMREDETSLSRRSGFDRRSRPRRIEDPIPGANRATAPSNSVVIGGKRLDDPDWLFGSDMKKPLQVPKDSILKDRFVTQGLLKKISRVAGPLMLAGGTMDLLSGGDPVNSEIAGDPEPGGELDQFAAERRGESTANRLILRRQLAEALAREGK